MNFPCSALPPTLYPGLLRPPAGLSLQPCMPRSLLPTSFLVDDLIRLSQPVTYLHRTFSSSQNDAPPCRVSREEEDMGFSLRGSGGPAVQTPCLQAADHHHHHHHHHRSSAALQAGSGGQQQQQQQQQQTHRADSPHTGDCSEATYLKFGVRAILAPSTQKGKVDY